MIFQAGLIPPEKFKGLPKVFIYTCTVYEVRGIKRERSHETFKGLATKGKTTIGWFFGFKLHIVINDKGEILDFVISHANTDDRQQKIS